MRDSSVEIEGSRAIWREGMRYQNGWLISIRP